MNPQSQELRLRLQTDLVWKIIRSYYRPPGHSEKANLPMFMQITETVKEAITLIIWDLNSAAMDQNENCGVAEGRGHRAGHDPRLFARKLC